MTHTMEEKLRKLVASHMMDGSRHVPARLQAALALLEKLRDLPSLELEDHLSAKGSSGLSSHETYGNRAHARLQLKKLNKNHGRRSSNLREWGQGLLDLLRKAGFEKLAPHDRDILINPAQDFLAKFLRDILEQEPFLVHVRGRSVEYSIKDVLRQAEEKGKSGDVSQYLVGAKLEQRLGIELPVLPANKGDRKSFADRRAKAGDFTVGNAVIEVAVGLPDDKHLEQVAEALADSESELWLLTRDDRVVTWKTELEKLLETAELRRVIVTSVEAFVGQNITEIGGFSTKGKSATILALFERYNERWIKKVGTPGMRIEIK